MRKSLLISLAILLALGGGIYFYSKTNHQKTKLIALSDDYKVKQEENDEEEEEGEKEDGIKESQEMEFDYTKDVKLGYIPKDRLSRTTDIQMRKFLARGFARTSALGITWQERGPNSDATGPSNGNTRSGNGITSGRIRAIWVDLADPSNKTVWVGGVAGGIWKTTDITNTNATWTLTNDYFANMAIAGICQDPTNTNIMYFGTGEKTYNIDAVRGGGVWKSVDHGITWSLLAGTQSFYNVSRILCDNSGNVYVATIGANGIQRSTDKGLTWTNITPSGLTSRVTDMEISSTGRMHIVCGYYNAINSGYRYTDNPATVSSTLGWTSPITPFPTNYNADIIVKGDTLYSLPATSAYQTPTVYKSVDGGDSWAATPANLPSTVSSGQAWYNMAIAMDPKNSNNLVVGGLNMFKSTDGGASWTQVSVWVGAGYSYVHADQQYATWNGDQVLVASDGGISISQDGGSTYVDRNKGLRLKQFYSIAAHPTNLNYFLAGAQDNGVHQLSQPGLGSSIEVTGGDGAFVAIDQLNPQYQFGSYVYNQYRRSTDGGNTWSAVNYSATLGQFINPFDYDPVSKKMYCGSGANEFIRWEDPTTGATFTQVPMSKLYGKVTHVSVSPYKTNRIYFGSTSGSIVRVDNANQSAITETALDNGTPGATVSCVAIGNDDNNLIATYSNYGTQHIWYSSNGGVNWTNVSGNFPDIPVRWAVFYPESNDKVILATEAGVWETSKLNGAATIWEQNTSFPFVRTDMIRYRKTDNSLAAGTHGRGVFTASLPAPPPYARFQQLSTAFAEAATNTTDGCRYYTDYTLNVIIDQAGTGDANATITAKPGGTALQGVDFDFTTNGSFTSPSNTFTIPSGSIAPIPIKIRVYYTAEDKLSNTFTLQMAVAGSTNLQAAPSGWQSNIEITNSKRSPVFSPPIQTYLLGARQYYLTSSGEHPLNIQLISQKSQMVYRADELTALGMTKGAIQSVGFDIAKYSSSPYKNLTIKMASTTLNYLSDASGDYPVATTVYKTLAQYYTTNGINEFVLDQPFQWDGTSNIVVEICYNNETTSAETSDRTIGYMDGGTSTQASMIWNNNLDCSQNFDINTLGGFGSGLKPRIQFKIASNANPIATAGSRTDYVPTSGNYYFYYNGTDIMNKISSASQPLGCVSSNLIMTGNNWQPYGNKSRSGKVFEITPSQNANATYNIGLYYTTAELAGKNPAELVIVKTNAATIDVTGGNSSNTVVGATTYQTYGNGYLFTASFSGFSKFFLSEKDVVIPVKLINFTGTIQNTSALLSWKTASEQNTAYFEVQKSKDGTNNFISIGRVAAAGNSNTIREYSLTDNNLAAVNYYRLKITDKDGKTDFSNTLLLRYNHDGQRMVVLGNPFRDEFKLQFLSTPVGPVRVELYATSGAKLFSKVFASSNLVEVKMEGNRLPKGTYFLKVFTDKEVYSDKVIKD